MNDPATQEIQSELQGLFDVLQDTLPVDRMYEHPFDCNRGLVSRICGVIREIAKEASDTKKKIEDEMERRIVQIKQYSRELEIPEPVFSSTQILPLKRLQVENEMNAISAIRKQVYFKIKSTIKEINSLNEQLGNEQMRQHEPTVVSLTQLRSFEGIKSEVEKVYYEREMKRQRHNERVKEILDILDREHMSNGMEAIHELEKKVEELERVLGNRVNEHAALIETIRELERDLQIEAYQVSDKLDDTSISAMKDHVNSLKKEHRKRFAELFQNKKAELTEINSVFGLETEEYPETEEGLMAMRNEIKELLPKKGLFSEIKDSIEKRKVLLEKMMEFEKIASDPRRLFKSSFQLNVEEKFRNTAYPSLLKLEDLLFDLIEKYENEFGTFICEGKRLKGVLKEEIDNRIINRTVFISRCDSPYRKRAK